MQKNNIASKATLVALFSSFMSVLMAQDPCVSAVQRMVERDPLMAQYAIGVEIDLYLDHPLIIPNVRCSGGDMWFHTVPSPSSDAMIRFQTVAGEPLESVIDRFIAETETRSAGNATWIARWCRNGLSIRPLSFSRGAVVFGASDPAIPRLPHPVGFTGFYRPEVKRILLRWELSEQLASDAKQVLFLDGGPLKHRMLPVESRSHIEYRRPIPLAHTPRGLPSDDEDWPPADIFDNLRRFSRNPLEYDKTLPEYMFCPACDYATLYVEQQQWRSAAAQIDIRDCRMQDFFLNTPLDHVFIQYQYAVSRDAQISASFNLQQTFPQGAYSLNKSDRARHQVRNLHQQFTVGTGAVGVYRPAVGLRAGGPYHASFLVEMPEAPPARPDWSVEVVLLMARFEDLQPLMQGYLDREARTFADGRPGHIEPIWRRDASTPYNPGWQTVSTRDVPAYAQTDGIPLPPGVEALALAVVGRNLGRAPIGIDFFTLTDGTCERLMREQ